MEVVDHPNLIALARLQQHSPRAIAKDHARSPVRIVDHRAHHVRANHHHLLVRAALHQLRPHLQRIRKPRASRRQVKPPGPLRPQLVLHQARRRRKEHIRRHRSHNDHLDLRAVIPRFARHAFAACTARSLVPTPGSTMCRSRIPVRSVIHWSFVATIFSRSALVNNFGGTYVPTELIFALTRTCGLQRQTQINHLNTNLITCKHTKLLQMNLYHISTCRPGQVQPRKSHPKEHRIVTLLQVYGGN